MAEFYAYLDGTDETKFDDDVIDKETGETPYDVLNLSSTATNKEIKDRYRYLVLKYHPDRGCKDHELFKKIQEAYFTLMQIPRDKYAPKEAILYDDDTEYLHHDVKLLEKYNNDKFTQEDFLKDFNERFEKVHPHFKTKKELEGDPNFNHRALLFENRKLSTNFQTRKLRDPVKETSLIINNDDNDNNLGCKLQDAFNDKNGGFYDLNKLKDTDLDKEDIDKRLIKIKKQREEDDHSEKYKNKTTLTDLQNLKEKKNKEFYKKKWIFENQFQKAVRFLKSITG